MSHVYSSDNAGDAALLSVLLADIQSIDPEADITILTLSPVLPGETYDGIPIRQSFMYYAHNRYRTRLLKLAYAGYVVAASTLRAMVYVRTGRKLPLGHALEGVMGLYEGSDAIIPVGGGYLRGDATLTSSVNLLLMLHPLFVGFILRKPTVLYPQSFGPFGNRMQSRVTCAILRRLDLIMAREDISVELLASEGVSSNVVRAVDAGFAFAAERDVDLREQLSVPPHHLLVGITVRRWLDPIRQGQYERAVAEFADTILERHEATVVFLPQVTSEHHDDDDRVVGSRVARAMRHRGEPIVDQFDHRTIWALYSSLDVLIGTRFHSVIFALTAMVPVLAIEYEHKTSGIMGDLALEKWVHDIRGVTGAGLFDAFEVLLAERDSYCQYLADRMPAYQSQARQSKELLSAVLDGRPSITSVARREEPVGRRRPHFGPLRISLLLSLLRGRARRRVDRGQGFGSEGT